MISKERFEETAYKMSYEEYKVCACTACNREDCIHREAYRRIPTIDGGLGLCPELIERKNKIKEIVTAKLNERESAGYQTLTDSDIMDILEEFERNNIEISRKELEVLGLRG